MPRFAANLTWLFGEVGLLDRFEAAARAGFEAVEILFPYDHEPAELRRRLDAFGLRQVLINVPPGKDAGHGLAAVPGREAEIRAGIARAIDYARALHCPRIHVMAGNVAPGVARADALDAYVANLRHAAEAMRPHGIRCLIEPLNDRDNPGYFLTRTEDARRVIGLVGGDNVRLQLDFYHRQIMEGGLAEAIEEYLPLIEHIQIAGVPGRHEPDVGEIAYPYLFDLLDRLGYQGWIGCEYRPLTMTLAGLGWARRWGVGRARVD